MGRKSQTIEEWIKAEKARQDWLDQKLRDAGLRRLTHEGQDTIDALISDLEEALPKGADRAEAIRKLKQNWRVFKSSQKNKTINLAANVSRHTRESLKKLAKARGETQKATLEKLIEEGVQTEADKKAAIKEAVNQAKLSHFEKYSPLEWPPLSSVFTRETESLRETVAEKDKEIQKLRKKLDSLSSTSIEKDESDIAPSSAPDIDDKAEPEPPKLEPTRIIGEILHNRKKPSF